ncbi:unnamed protein product [Linum tenue]|uniref:Uncharacterized protein n=1 Tax=Linum tenue TaxID=586396 RepID=A0AAV0KUR8_9ROSI|nr:unnamed protein product [Linum tenue]
MEDWWIPITRRKCGVIFVAMRVPEVSITSSIILPKIQVRCLNARKHHQKLKKHA